MKKQFCIILASIFLTACAAKDVASEQKTNVTQEATDVANVVESKETEAYSSLSLSDDELNYISEKMDLDSYVDECKKALNSIGFSAITDATLESAEVSSTGDIDESLILTDSNGKKVKMSYAYFSSVDRWSVIIISNTVGDKCYFVPEGSRKYSLNYSS